jgi:hypothetical protein
MVVVISSVSPNLGIFSAPPPFEQPPTQAPDAAMVFYVLRYLRECYLDARAGKHRCLFRFRVFYRKSPPNFEGERVKNTTQNQDNRCPSRNQRRGRCRFPFEKPQHDPMMTSRAALEFNVHSPQKQQHRKRKDR